MKRKKLDPRFVSKQKHEIAYIVKRFTYDGYKINSALVRKAVKEVGKSRLKVYAYLRDVLN